MFCAIKYWNMIFRRKIYDKLLEWKNDKNHKPLIIRGARQVGKTTLIKQFSNNYKFKIFLNLERKSDLEYFKKNQDIKYLLESILLDNNISIDQIKNTILFIDEIQESSEAIKMLRYFYEDYPDLDVIAAGSLLEFAIKSIKAFPVGRIEYLYMHPFNFSEFLEASNKNQMLREFNKIPIENSAHNSLMKKFNEFTIIGGMPEIIKIFVESGSYTTLSRIYESILTTYKNDIEKYGKSEIERKVIIHITNTAQNFIDKRITFQNFGNSNYKSREVGEAMRILDSSRFIKLIYPTTNISTPLIADLKKSPKLQFLDTGILNYALRIQADAIGMDDLSEMFRGAIIPHIINQEMISIQDIRDEKPMFWVRDKSQASSEVDLVFVYKNKVIPIEIKSGLSGKLRSLQQFIDKTDHIYAVRMYAGLFDIHEAKTPNGKRFLLMNLPYYLGSKIPEYIAYFVNNYSFNEK